MLQKNFVRNVFTAAAGAGLVQAITFLFFPAITRIYEPGTLGVFGVFNSLLSIFGPAAALTYPVAIVLPRHDQEARRLISLSLFIALCASVVTGGAILIFGESLVNTLGLDLPHRYLWFLPAAMISVSAVRAFQQWLLRKKQFKSKVKMDVIHALASNCAKAGLGLWRPLASVLISTAVAAHGLHALLLARAAARGGGITGENKSRDDLTPAENKSTWPALAHEYSEFPKYRAPQVVLSGFSQAVPVLLLALFFTPVSAGFYTIARRSLKLPTELFGQAIGDVFYPRIAEARRSGENISAMLIKTTTAMLLLGIIPGIIVFLFGPLIFGFVFGSDWSTAGIYARWLAIWSLFEFSLKPSTRILSVLSEQRLLFFITAVQLSLGSAALIIGGYIIGDETKAVFLYSLSGAAASLCLIGKTMIKSRKHDARLEW